MIATNNAIINNNKAVYDAYIYAIRANTVVKNKWCFNGEDTEIFCVKDADDKVFFNILYKTKSMVYKIENHDMMNKELTMRKLYNIVSINPKLLMPEIKKQIELVEKRKQIFALSNPQR